MPAKQKTTGTTPRATSTGKQKPSTSPGGRASKATPGGRKTVKAGRPAARKSKQKSYTVRVRMYRHGLGDCHLLSFPREGRDPFHLLIDFGVLNRDAAFMRSIAAEIEETVRGASKKPRIDLVAVTHEHKDHVSGFNQARDVFDRIEIGAVWMGWTEKPGDKDAEKLAHARKLAATQLRAALASPRAGKGAAAVARKANLTGLLQFAAADNTLAAGRKTIADAMAYLRERGRNAGAIEYLKPGTGPLELDGVDGVRVYVFGPPTDRAAIKRSTVTQTMQDEGVVYHLGRGGDLAMAANVAALSATDNPRPGGGETDTQQPFSRKHGITRSGPWWGSIAKYVASTYDASGEEWRRIDDEWLGAFDQLALQLDSDTNNTSLVLAFEIVATGDVLLFVGDAQVGNWQSWSGVEFDAPDGKGKVAARDLLRRTVLYKVGHHASHNATLKTGGLEDMQSGRLVGFIPLDRETAAAQGRTDPSTGKPSGWEMPAKALYKALKKRTGNRLVISDVKEKLSTEAAAAGVRETDTYVEIMI
ncbi:MAG: hypothetical protein IPP94_16870 [Ignavibacteria bacterium]|nr:hypothetical protein [Ignavibacteria bacterium]